MAVATPNFNYTYDGKLSTDTIICPSVMTPDILKVFTVRQGVKSLEQLNISQNLEKIVKSVSGCGNTSTGDGIEIFNRTLETTQMGVYLEQCADVFEDTVYELALKSGLDVNNLSGTQIARLIMDLVTDAMRRDNFRIFSFADTTSGSADYDMIDGLWKKLIDGVATYDVIQCSSTMGTTPLADGGALAVLKEMYEGADVILKQLPINEKKFYVTGSFLENLQASYESNSTGSDAQFLTLVQGQVPGESMWRYRGIEVIGIYAWDSALADPDNPLNATTANLALYTTPKNHIIGVEKPSDITKVKTWYSDDDDIYKIKAKYKMGYNYACAGLQVICL